MVKRREMKTKRMMLEVTTKAIMMMVRRRRMRRMMMAKMMVAKMMVAMMMTMTMNTERMMAIMIKNVTKSPVSPAMGMKTMAAVANLTLRTGMRR